MAKIGLSRLAAAFMLLLGATAVHAAETEQRWQPVLEQGGVAVVLNRRALPRAWLVSEVHRVSAEQALKAIRGETRDEFDPARTALLEVSGADLPRLGGTVGPNDRATVQTSADGHVVVDTRSQSPSFLVVSESYFPGWRATIDGNRAPVFQTNYILLGVPVPAGAHRVEMHYAAVGARSGLIISSLTLSIMIALGFYTWHKSRSVRPRSPVHEGSTE